MIDMLGTKYSAALTWYKANVDVSGLSAQTKWI